MFICLFSFTNFDCSYLYLKCCLDYYSTQWTVHGALDKSVGRWACSGSGSVLTKPYCLTLSIQWHTIVQTEIKFLSFNLTFLGNNYFFNSKKKSLNSRLPRVSYRASDGIWDTVRTPPPRPTEGLTPSTDSMAVKKITTHTLQVRTDYNGICLFTNFRFNSGFFVVVANIAFSILWVPTSFYLHSLLHDFSFCSLAWVYPSLC